MDDTEYQSSGVSAPGQVVLGGDAQKCEGSHPLHTVPADEQRLDVCFFPPIVHYQLFGLGGVEDQFVVPTPH